MNQFLAALSGVIIAVMIFINGELGLLAGSYFASVIIHIVGLCAITLILLAGRMKVRAPKGLPLFLYSGGVLGVLTTVGNIVSVNHLDVTLTLALGLLGQLLASVIVDTFGLLGAKKQGFERRKLAGILFITAGTGAMLLF